MRVLIMMAAAVLASALCAPQAFAVKEMSGLPPSLQVRLVKLETRLDDQIQAADRQGEAFDAAVSRIEIVNAALVAFIALAGLAGGILAVKWVRHTAHEQISIQVEEAGKKVFEEEAASLRATYEEQFAAQYRRYKRLTDSG